MLPERKTARVPGNSGCLYWQSRIQAGVPGIQRFQIRSFKKTRDHFTVNFRHFVENDAVPTLIPLRFGHKILSSPGSQADFFDRVHGIHGGRIWS